MRKIQDTIRTLPEKKQYAELITAVLSVPVLITVLLLNLNNLRAKPSTSSPQVSPTLSQSTPTPTTTHALSGTTIPQSITPTAALSPTPGVCIKSVGPVEISSPSEGETITSNPVCITITQTGSNYCQVAWSYHINNDPWSEYMDNTICLYNLSSGQKTINVRVKSIASSDQTILTRSFIIPITASPTTQATSSAQQP